MEVSEAVRAADQQRHDQRQHTQTSKNAGSHAAGESGTSSRKRGREGEENGHTEVEKRGCEEGMSWWTCLMLGVSQDNSRQQVVKKVYHQKEN